MDLRGRGARVVVVGAVVALLAGCTNGPEPQVTPTPTPVETVVESPSPTPTPSPSPTALTDEEVLAAIPAAARHEGFYGAQEFARFFLIESQDMVREQDGRLFEALSDSDCIFCQTSLGVLQRHLDEDLSVEGGEVVVLDEFAQGACESETSCHVEFDVDIAPTKWLDARGTVVADSAAEWLRVAVQAKYVDGFWVTTGVGSEERAG